MKDSGISWVGLIPSHWNIKRAKFLFSLAKRPPHSDDGIVTAFRDGQVTLRSNRRTEGFTNAAKEAGYQRVLKGDLVIHAMDAFAGAIGVSDSDGKCTPVYSCCVPGNEATSEFYARCVRTMSTTGFIESLAKGIRERSTDFRWATFAEQLLPHPPKAEQDAIVAYLDREATRIDALVAKKTRFIGLLCERRQALITHVVTKGLDANVPMKDSGVEWLGQVPAHWKISALKHLVSTAITDGPHETPAKQDEGVRFISAEAVSSGKIDFSKAWGLISNEDNERFSKKYRPARNDIYMIKSGATTGVVAIVDGDTDFNIWSPLAAIRPSQKVVPRFLLHALRSAEFQAGVALNWSYGTQQNIGMKVLEALPVPTPPVEEQRLIAISLDHATARIDTLIAKTERSIDLLREHRTALITAAVTGKIDLREAA